MVAALASALYVAFFKRTLSFSSAEREALVLNNKKKENNI